MARYAVEFSSRASRQLRKMESAAGRRLARAIDSLAEDPRKAGVVALSDTDDLFRLRVGTYRIIFTIEDDRLVVLVVKIGHRRDIYREPYA